MTNYIPHETNICDDRDAPWINKCIKELIHVKNDAYKYYRQNTFFHKFEFVRSKLNSQIVKVGKNYYVHLKIIEDYCLIIV